MRFKRLSSHINCYYIHATSIEFTTAAGGTGARTGEVRRLKNFVLATDVIKLGEKADFRVIYIENFSSLRLSLSLRLFKVEEMLNVICIHASRWTIQVLLKNDYCSKLQVYRMIFYQDTDNA